MAGAHHNITIPQNATLRLELEWVKSNGEPNPMVGCDVKMQIRDKEGGKTLYGTWEIGSGISIEPELAIMAIYIHSNESSSWSFPEAFYDVVVTWPDASKDVLLRGKVKLRKGVTV